MVEINVQLILSMLSQSIGIEGAEKVINEAIRESGLPRAAFYSEEEFKLICGNLEKKGGFIKIFASLAITNEYREKQYQILIEKEKKEKHELGLWAKEIETLNEELRISNEKLKIANEELKIMHEKTIRSEKLATIGRLASGVGHELRNPLASIKNISFCLKKYLKSTDSRINELLDMLSKEVDTANKIVTDLLDFSRVKQLNNIEVSLIELIDDAIKAVVTKDNIKIIKNVPTNLKNIFIDKDKIRQVFINIIENAYQSINSSGELRIAANIEGEVIKISFTDTGCGIDKNIIDHIFEPLFTTKAKGIGLGLAIVRDIIESHNGLITVESEVGKNTTFTILLPITGAVNDR